MIKIKGKLKKESMMVVNQGYYTDGNIALLIDYVQSTDVTIQGLIMANNNGGLNSGYNMNQLPNIEKVLLGPMKNVASRLNSNESLNLLQDTELTLRHKGVKDGIRILFSQDCKSYIYLDNRYINYLDQFNFKYTATKDYKGEYSNRSPIAILDKDCVVVGVIMPIIIRDNNEYLKEV